MQWLETIYRHTILVEGSTRAVGLMRIGMAFLLWARWGDEFLPWRELSLENPVIMLIGAVFLVSTLLMCIGLWSRVSTGMAALAALEIYYYIGRVLGHSTYAHHNSYALVIATVLVALTPCGRSYSVDRWLRIRRALRHNRSIPPERGPLWGTRLIGLQVSTIYFWSAWDKTNWAFLSGDRMEAIYMDKYFGSDFPALPGFHKLMVVTSVATVALEYALAFGLWFRRPRKWLLPLGILMHLVMYYTLRVHTFTATMLLMYLAYISPEYIHRVTDQIAGHNLDRPQSQSDSLSKNG